LGLEAGTNRAARGGMVEKEAPNSGSDDYYAIATAFRDLHRGLRLAELATRKHLGVSNAQLLVLEAASMRPGISINELAQITRTHQSSVSSVVAALRDRGYVDVRRGLEDFRVVRIRLKRRGRDVVKKAAAPNAHLLRDSVERLDSTERAALLRSLNTLLQAMKDPPAKSPRKKTS
jgi:DNA-binding MarR family transcriptional regulator